MLTAEEVKTWGTHGAWYCGDNEAYEVLQNPDDPKECAVLWYKKGKLEKGKDAYYHPDESTIKVVYQTNGKGSLKLAFRWASDAFFASPTQGWQGDADDPGISWVGKPFKLLRKAKKKGAKLKSDDDSTDQLPPSGQGYIRQAILKRAVELCAVAAAEAHYRKLGYKVENTSATLPYDLRCHKRKEEVRVEAKGSSGDGAEVFLTAGEVQNARNSGVRTDLFVWGFIEIIHDGTDTRGVGGRLVFLCERWNPSDADLAAMQYRYRIPS